MLFSASQSLSENYALIKLFILRNCFSLLGGNYWLSTAVLCIYNCKNTFLNTVFGVLTPKDKRRLLLLYSLIAFIVASFANGALIINVLSIANLTQKEKALKRA